MNPVRTIILFGYSEYAREIARHVNHVYERLVIYTLSQQEEASARADGMEVFLTDLDDEWDELGVYPAETTRYICALADEAENVFLTISLRDRFPEVVIIALATTQENANKLKLAGADKVIAELQTTANLIIDLLEKPVITRLLEELMDTTRHLQVAQIILPVYASVVGKQLSEVMESVEQNVILLAVVDHRMSESFIFTARGQNHQLDPGDVLVVIGYDKDIKAFEAAIGARG